MVRLDRHYYPYSNVPCRCFQVLTSERMLTIRQRFARWSLFSWLVSGPAIVTDFELAQVTDVRIIPYGRSVCEVHVQIRGSAAGNGIVVRNRQTADVWAEAIREGIAPSSASSGSPTESFSGFDGG